MFLRDYASFYIDVAVQLVMGAEYTNLTIGFRRNEVMMEKKEKLLTIAIPTYNRDTLLRKQLERIFKSNKVNLDIEIIVSNNCSIDNTELILERFEKKYDNFRYHNNDTNLGFDGNIKKLYNLANGKYVWFLSDDDYLTNNAIDYVYSMINKCSDVGLIVVPHLINDKIAIKNENDVIPYYPIGEKIEVLIGKQSEVVSDKQRLNLLLLAAQISGCIVLKSVELERFSAYGGGVMHCKIANLNLLENPRYFIIDKGLVKNGKKETISKWFMDSTLFGIRKLYLQKEMEFSDDLIDLVSVRTCQLGLNILKKRNVWAANYVNYPEMNDEIIANLKCVFGEKYYLIQSDVNKVLKARKYKGIHVGIIRPLLVAKYYIKGIKKFI